MACVAQVEPFEARFLVDESFLVITLNMLSSLLLFLTRNRYVVFEEISNESVDLIQVLANTMGGLHIKGSGVFFDKDKFQGPNYQIREYFGPYAWRFEKKDPTAGPER